MKGRVNKATTVLLSASMVASAVPVPVLAAAAGEDDPYVLLSETDEVKQSVSVKPVDAATKEMADGKESEALAETTTEEVAANIEVATVEEFGISTMAADAEDPKDYSIHIDIDERNEDNPWHVSHLCPIPGEIGESDIVQTEFVKGSGTAPGVISYACNRCGMDASLEIPQLDKSTFIPTAETMKLFNEGTVWDGQPLTLAYDIADAWAKWIPPAFANNFYCDANTYRSTIGVDTTFYYDEKIRTDYYFTVRPRPVEPTHNFESKYYDGLSIFRDKEISYVDINGAKIVVPHEFYLVMNEDGEVGADPDKPVTEGAAAGVYAVITTLPNQNYIWSLGSGVTGRTIQFLLNVWPTANSITVGTKEEDVQLKGIADSEYTYTIIPGISGFDSSRPGETQTTVQVSNASGVVDTVELPVFVIAELKFEDIEKDYDGLETPVKLPDDLTGIASVQIQYTGNNTQDEYYEDTKPPVDAGKYTATLVFTMEEGYDAVDPITINYIINRAKQNVPAPQLETSTTDSITLVRVTNAEYSLDGLVWQDSPRFDNLEPGQSYTLYQKLKGDNNHEESEAKSGVFTTGQHEVEAPTLEEQRYTYNGNEIPYKVPGIPLVTKTTVQYTLPDGTVVENAPVSAGRYPVTVSFEMQPGAKQLEDISTVLIIDKANREAPAAPKANTVGTTSIVLAPVSGVSYSIDDGVTWTTSNLFEGLKPDTKYTVLAKYPEDTNYNESPTSSSVITTSKQSSSVPTVESAVYVYDGTPKQLVADPPIGCIEVVQTFTGTGNTVYGPTTEAPTNPGEYKVRITYTMEAGYSEVPAQNASMTIRKGEQEAPTAPIVLAFTDTSITIQTEPGNAYSIDGGQTWQTDGEFKGLTRDTAYTIQVKKLATSTHNEIAGPSTIQMTDKTVVDFPMLTDQTVEYTGHAVTYTLPKSILGVSSMQITGYDGKPEAPTAVGEYVVDIDFTPAAGYKLPDDIPTPKLVITYNSMPVNPTLRNETATYTGSPLSYHGADDVEGTTGATILYTGIDGTNYPESSVAPTNVGTYKVEAIFTPDGGHIVADGPFTATFTINKANQSAPVNAAVQSTTATTVTVSDIPGAEYSIDGGKTWQSGNTFENLEACTSYTILVRMAEDENHNASPSKAVVATTTKHPIVMDVLPDFNTIYNGNGQPYPNTSLVSDKEGVKSVNVMYFGTLANGNTYESSVAPVNAGDYTVRFYVVPETNYELGDQIVTAQMTIDKAQQEMSQSPTIANRTTTTITLNPVPGAEYSIDGGKTWQSSPRFVGLTPDTEYTFTQRLAGTDNLYPSESKEVNGKTFADTGLVYTIDYFDEVIHFDPNIVDGGKNYGMTDKLVDGSTIMPGETIYVRLVDDGTGTSGPVQMEVLPDRPATPDINVNPYDFTMNSTSDMEFSLDGGVTWTDCTDQQIMEDHQGATVLVRIKATEDSFRSESCTVKVPVRDTAPVITIDNDKETMDSKDTMEYSMNNGVTWVQTLENMSVSQMTGDTMWVRTSCDGVKPASNYAVVTVPTRNTAPQISISNTEETMYMDGVKPQWLHEGKWEDVGETLDVSDKCGQTINVRECFDATHFASLPVEVMVPMRGVMPDLVINRFDRNMNTTDSMEYSTDGGVTWNPTGQGMDLSDLAGQTILVREKATDTQFVSESTTVVVPNYAVDPDVSLDTRGETIDTTQSMDYSPDGGKTWIEAPDGLDVSKLTGQDIVVRAHGSEDEFPSKGVTITIPERRDAPEVDVNNKEEVIVPTSGTEYSVDGGNTWISSTDPLEVSDYFGKEIIIRYPATDDEFASNGVTVVLPSRPGAPVIVVNPADKTINTTIDMEFSTDGGKTWVGAEPVMDVEDLAGTEILVRYPADKDKPASDATTVRIPEKQEKPDSKLDTSTGVITPTAGTEYSTDGGATWKPSKDPMDVTDLEGETVLIRKPGDDKHFPSDSVEIVVPERRPTPDAGVNFPKETLTTDSTMEYSTDGGKTWKKTTPDMGADDLMGQTVLIRNAGDENHLPSDSVEVKVPTRPSAPNVGHTDETRAGKSDGTLTNTVAGMEYREQSGSWKPITGDAVKDLAAGIYEVRYAATETAFASNSQTVTIGKGASVSTGSGGSSGGGGGSSSGRFDVDFNTGGGSDIKDQTVKKNESVSRPSDPTKDGYAFGGWYTDKNLTSQYDFGGKVTGDMTLYAKWIAIPEDDVPKAGGIAAGISNMLNKEDHIAYISGRSATHMAPKANVTRGEVASMLYRLLSVGAIDAYGTSESAFSDVSTGAWNCRAISTLAKAGIISGYEDGSFKPNKPITRAELASMLVRFSNVSAESSEDKFTDIAGHWARAAINKAAEAGIVSGYKNGQFKPNNNVTRAETVAMINRLLGRSCDASGVAAGYKTFTDVKESAWYYWDIVEAANGHDYTMTGEGEVWSKLK